VTEIANRPALTWRDTQTKFDAARFALAGRNCAAARRVVAPLAADLERLPQKGFRPC
jgi:hypothetical protein